MKIQLLILHLILVQLYAYSQFNNVPFSGGVTSRNCAATNPSNTFALIGSNEIFKSTANPNVWTQISNFSPSDVISFKSIEIINSSTIFAVGRNISNGYEIIAKTTNSGLNWSLYNLAGTFTIIDIAENNGTLIAVGTNGIIYRSTNLGVNWFQISSNTIQDLNTIEYDNNNSTWYIGGDNIKLTSTNDGMSFSNQILTNSIVDISFFSNIRTEITNDNSNTTIRAYNGTILSSTLNFSSLYQNICLLPDGKFLVSSHPNKLAICDFNNSTYTQFNDSIINISNNTATLISDITVLGNKIFAIGLNAYAYMNFPILNNQYVPADFSISQTQGCPIENYTINASLSNATSYSFYLDNILISNNGNYSGSFPSTFGPHNIKLITNFNGILDSSIQYIYSNYINPILPSFNLNYDDTICYNQNVSFNFSNNTSGINWQFIIEHNQSVIYQSTIASNFTFNLPNLIEHDTVFIHFKQITFCDTFNYHYSYPIFVKQNYSEYISFSSLDNNICFPQDSFHINIITTVPLHLNLYSETFPPGFSYATAGASLLNQNLNVDTFLFSYNSDLFFDSYFNNTATYPNYQYNYNNDTIHANIQVEGCIFNMPVLNFVVNTSATKFYFSQLGTPLGESVDIINQLPGNSQEWSSTITNGLQTNLLTNQPIFKSFETGCDTIYLINQSFPQCEYNTEEIHYFLMDITDSVASISKCNQQLLNPLTIRGTQVTKDGGMIEYGSIYYLNQNYSQQIIRKIDANGNLTWEKTNPNTGPNNIISCAVIDSLNRIFYIALNNTNTSLVIADKFGNTISSFNLQNINVNEIFLKGNFVFVVNDNGLHKYSLTNNLGSLSYVQSVTFPTSPLNFYNPISQNEHCYFLNSINDSTLSCFGNFSSNGFQPMTFGDTTISVTSNTSLICFVYNINQNTISNARVITTSNQNYLLITRDVLTDSYNNHYFTINPGIQRQFYLYDSSYYNNVVSGMIVKTNSLLIPQQIALTNSYYTIDILNDNQIIISDITEDGVQIVDRMNSIFTYFSNNSISTSNNLNIGILDSNLNMISGKSIGITSSGLNNYFITPAYPNFFLSFDRPSSYPMNTTNLFFDSNTNSINFTHNATVKLTTTNCIFLNQNQEICAESPIDINVQSGFDSILCILNDGVSIDSTYFIPTNNFITIPTTPASDFDLTIVLDSINTTIHYDNLNSNVIDFPDSIIISCNQEYYLALNSTGFSSFAWYLNNDYITNVSYALYNGEFLTYDSCYNWTLITTDLNQCTDEQPFVVLNTNPPVPTGLDPLYYLPCNGTLTLSIDSNAFSNIQWSSIFQSDTGSTFFLDDALISSINTFSVYVSAIDSNGCQLSEVFHVDACSDLNTHSEESTKIQVYPNPFDNKVLITSALTTDYQLSLINSIGSTIVLKECRGDQELDLTELPPGLYTIFITNQSTRFQTKLIKK